MALRRRYPGSEAEKAPGTELEANQYRRGIAA